MNRERDTDLCRTRTRRRHRGASMLVIVISLIALLALMALVVDLSLMHIRRQANVNGCDAAALAGAMELPDQSAARAKAQAVAASNGLTGTVTVSFPNQYEVLVTIKEDVSLGISRAVGIRTGQVTARSLVRRGPANVVTGNTPAGLRPWGLGLDFAINYSGQSVPLKLGSRSTNGSTTSPGNFYSVRFPGSSGGADYENNVKYGGSGTFRVGDSLDIEPGNKIGPSLSGVTYVLQRANVSPWNQQSPPNVTPDNPRVILMPLIDWSRGGKTVTIAGFAAVYITGMNDQGEVTGIFLQKISGLNVGSDPGIPPGPSGTLLTMQLVE